MSSRIGGGGGRSGAGRTGGFTIGGPGMGSGLWSGTMVRVRGGLAEPYTAATTTALRAPDGPPPRPSAPCPLPSAGARATNAAASAATRAGALKPRLDMLSEVTIVAGLFVPPMIHHTPVRASEPAAYLARTRTPRARLPLDESELARREDERPLNPSLSTLHLHANIPIPRHLRPHSRM